VRVQLSTSNGKPLDLEIPDERLVADCSQPRESLAGQRKSLSQALQEPLGYPPLDQAILPGDHVTIAVDPETPGLVKVVSELAGELIHAGCSPSDLTVLLSQDRKQSQQMSIAATWPPLWRREIKIVSHEPEDETAHAYLAATREGRPVYLNRAIGDADVVIPVGLMRLDDALDSRGVHGSWFPVFSNLETQFRHQSPGNVQWQTHQRRRREETEEAAWLLGVRLVIQVLPGPAGSVAGVWCGDAEQVARQGGEAYREAWSFEVDRSADLVIAALDVEPSQQSWRQVARALAMAARAVADDGAIVLWTALSEDPGPALKTLADVEATEEEQRLALLKHRSADATAAKVIADCLTRCRVYLHSDLEDSLVEEIGLAPLHDAVEVERLIAHASSCTVIGSAQYAGIRIKQPVEA